MDLDIPENGILQLYTANETADQNVWFDDFKVTFTPQLIVQENHYYPFGLELAGISKVNRPEYRFKFGGKEFDKTFGLNWGDFHARQHDPALGRWFVVDPKANQFYDVSPYNYALNNPPKFVDPDGQAPLDHIYMYADGRVAKINRDAKGPHRLFIFHRNDNGYFTVDREVKGVSQKLLGRLGRGSYLDVVEREMAAESNASSGPKLPGWLRTMNDLNPVVSGMNIISGVARGKNIYDEKMSGGDYVANGMDVAPVAKILKFGKGILKFGKQAKRGGKTNDFFKQITRELELSPNQKAKLTDLNKKLGDHAINWPERRRDLIRRRLSIKGKDAQSQARRDIIRKAELTAAKRAKNFNSGIHELYKQLKKGIIND